MNREADRYFAIALGSTTTEVRERLGEPAWIAPRHGEQQWAYKGGRFVLTFAGTGPQLIRIAHRPQTTQVPSSSPFSTSTDRSKKRIKKER